MPAIPSGTLDKFTTFGDLLRYLRRRAGLTQMELSIAVNYSDAQISRLEQNLRLPDVSTIEERFVSALGLEDEPKAVARLLELAATIRREDAPGPGLCPYKGLDCYEEADAELFAGRETLTAKLTQRVLGLCSGSMPGSARFLAITGASGSGKSSLARAGLAPALRWNRTSAGWTVRILTPTTHPLESLAASLTRDAGSMIATAGLMDDLAREPRSLGLFSRQVLKLSAASHLVLVVDQFEELFTLCRSEDERSPFIDNLLTAASEPDGRVVVVITLRADFYAHCAAYPALREAIAGQQEYIGAMDAEELRRAIEEPARRGRWDLEPGLVELLLRDVGQEPGALPLLSHALWETWQRRRGHTLTLGGYTASGGVAGAIAETAESVFADRFTAEQRTIARRIFLRLTELGDENASGATRRCASFDELILRPDEAAATQAVLQVLAEARLITIDEDSAEVAHEALIREWPTLRGWLAENREGLRLHRNLSEAALGWLKAGREPDLLHRGARLAQAREWAATHDGDLNLQEREFLAAAIAFSEREAAAREEQRERELAAAQKLADVERQRAAEQACYAAQLRRWAVFLAGAFVVAVAMALVAISFGSQARQAAAAAQEERRIGFSRELAAEAIGNLDADPELSILLATQAVSVTYTQDQTATAEAEDALRRGLLASRVELTLSPSGSRGRAWAVAFSPDGARLAVASDDGSARIWATGAGGHELLVLPTNATRGNQGIAFSPALPGSGPGGMRVLTAVEMGKARVWDAETGAALLTLTGHTNWVTGVAFSPDGRRLATASEDRTARIWDAATGQSMLVLTGHTAKVLDVAFSPAPPGGAPDEARVATGSADGTAIVWSVQTGERLFILSGHTGGVVAVAFSPAPPGGGAYLATAGADGTTRLWDAAGRLLLTLRGHTDAISDVAFSPAPPGGGTGGQRLATAGIDGKVKLWDAATGQELLTLYGRSGSVNGLAFSPDCPISLWPTLQSPPPELCGTRLATAQVDGTARIWNASFSREFFTLDIPHASAEAVSPDGARLAAGLPDGVAGVWDLAGSVADGGAAGQPLLTWQAHEGAVSAMVFSPDGRQLATAGEDRSVNLWDPATGTKLRTLAGEAGMATAITFSPNGAYLAAIGRDRAVRVWDVASGRLVWTLTVSTLGYAIALGSAAPPGGAGGTRVAAGANDGTVKVWDVATGEEILAIRGHAGEVWGVAFSPDGRLLATAGNDGTAKVWEIAPGANGSHIARERLTLAGHNGAVNGIMFSPDGLRLATAGQDGTAKLWDASTGREVLSLAGQTDAVAAVSFASGCGETGCRPQLFTTSVNGMVRAYLLRIEDLMDLAAARLTRPMTPAECRQYLHVAPEQCGQDNPATTPLTASAPAEPVAALLAPARSARNGVPGSKVCEVTDSSGVNDGFYNQAAFRGMQEAAARLGLAYAVFESQQPADYATNVARAVESGCSLIVAPIGSNFGEIIKAAAAANPDRRFFTVERAETESQDNVWVQTYAVDQAGFLAGYLAAAVTTTGKVGTFGGVAFPLVTGFMDGFSLGVAYYNEQHGARVQVLGWDVQKRDGLFTGSFTDTSLGRRVGMRLLDQGADILLPVAGAVGMGTAAAIKERGNAYLIGVDTDWTLTAPEYADIVLTSIEKRVDVSVAAAIEELVAGSFTGGTHPGTLENGGVSIAPFHDLDGVVTPEIKAELAQIKAGIIAGRIKTKP